MKKITTEEFIEKSKLIWGDRFDYSLVEYINNNTKVKIICPINGVFEQQPRRHLEGRETLNKKIEYKQKFIERANEKFNFKFDYSLVEYKNNDDKVIIICPIHGQFEQNFGNHLNSKYGCNDCKKDVSNAKKVVKEKVVKEKLDKIKIDRKELFFKKCFENHGDRYDYSITEFKTSNDKVKIICREHGVFEQRASAHTSGQGCMECRLEKRRTGLDAFLSRSYEIHGDRYDYSLVTEYINSQTKVDVICKEHGIFKISPNKHTNGEQGCAECKKLGLTKFIEESNITHNYKYDYSLINEYVNNKHKVDIICKKHGVFNQRISDHMLRGSGCPVCSESKGEITVRKYLTDMSFYFTGQKRFAGCKYKSYLPFDFYLPNYNICIEFQGPQHYMPIDFFGGTSSYILQVKKDTIKKEYCEKNNIPLICIKYTDDLVLKLTTELLSWITIITQSQC